MTLPARTFAPDVGSGIREPDPELSRFLEPYGVFLRRSESRHALLSYVAGLHEDIPSKTASEIARAIPGTSSQRLQEFLTRTSWNERALNARRIERLVERAADGEGTLVLRELTIPKAGSQSVGAARQCRGPRGGSLNCQRIVAAHYADARHDWPVSMRLYLPHEWCTDVDRRETARVPDTVGFRSPAAIALELVAEARTAGVPFTSIEAEAGLADEEPLRSTMIGDRPARTPGLGELARRVEVARAFHQHVAPRFGLHDYEGRLWQGLHRHLALVMLAATYRMLARQD